MALSLAVFGAANCDPGQANAKDGSPIWVGVTVQGGSGPYTVTISSGSLPTGMTLNPIRIATAFGQDCFEIKGTPTTPGTYTFNVHAVDTLSATGDVSATVVVSSIQNFEMGFPPASQSVAYSFQLDQDFASSAFAFVGGPFSPPCTFGPIFWSPSSPGPLVISSGGLITGTPTASTLSPFDPTKFEASITVTDNVGHQVGVNNPLTIYGIPISISCGSPIDGTTGIAYFHTFPTSHGVSPLHFAIISGSLPPGLGLNSTTGQVTGTPTLAGTYPFTVQVTDTTGFTASVGCSITISSSGPSIGCGSPPGGIAGSPYTHAFPASGGTSPYTFAITSGFLPAGILLDPGTGIVSGVPTIVGTYPFTIQVTDASSATASVGCSIVISPGLVASCNNPPSGTVGVPYSHGLSVSGGTPPYTWALVGGELPVGLSLDPGTGTISGTPLLQAPYTFFIRVVDSLGAVGNLTCTITISTGPAPPGSLCPGAPELIPGGTLP